MTQEEKIIKIATEWLERMDTKELEIFYYNESVSYLEKLSKEELDAEYEDVI